MQALIPEQIYLPVANCAAAGGGNLARAVRPLPIRVITISKKNSKGAQVMAGRQAAIYSRDTIIFSLLFLRFHIHMPKRFIC